MKVKKYTNEKTGVIIVTGENVVDELGLRDEANLTDELGEKYLRHAGYYNGYEWIGDKSIFKEVYYPITQKINRMIMDELKKIAYKYTNWAIYDYGREAKLIIGGQLILNAPKLFNNDPASGNFDPTTDKCKIVGFVNAKRI